MSTRYYLLFILLILAPLCGCISSESGKTAQIETSDCEDEYDELEERYAELNSRYDKLYDDYIALQQTTSSEEYGDWQYHLTYYRANFSDIWDDYYIWIYSSYDNLIYWKTLDHPLATESISSDLINNYVVYSGERTLIDSIASVLSDMVYSDKQYAEAALSFVHSAIYYMYDDESSGVSEYWKYPDETLFDKVGDCEDTTFLYASLLRAVGIPTIILEYDTHLAVGVGIDDFYGTYYMHDGNKYYYAETTSGKYDEDVGEDFKIGEIPEEFDMAYIHPIV